MGKFKIYETKVEITNCVNAIQVSAIMVHMIKDLIAYSNCLAISQLLKMQKLADAAEKLRVTTKIE